MEHIDPVGNHINIFLGSSIKELGEDRDKISDYIRELNEEYHKKGIFISLIRCEDARFHTMSSAGSQKLLDNEIKNSALSVFLVSSRLGEVTRHEYDVAWEGFQSTARPVISIYFKTGFDDIDGTVTEFKGHLRNEKNYYYNEYSNIDTVKLDIIMKIQLLGMDHSEITVKDNGIYFNNRKVTDIDQIPSFALNTDLTAKREKLKELSSRFYSLREQHLLDPDDEDTYDRYVGVASRKAALEEEIEKIEANILNMVRNMSHDFTSGALSARQVEGYRLFEKGDYQGALEVLNYKAISNEMEQNLQIADEFLDRLQININELVQRANILHASLVAEETANEIIALYDKAVSFSIKYHLDTRFVTDYMKLLEEQHRYHKLHEVTSLFMPQLENPNALTDETVIQINYHYGNALHNIKHYEDASKVFRAAINHSIAAGGIKSQYWLGKLYHTLATSCVYLDQSDEAVDNINHSIQLFETVAVCGEDEYVYELSKCYTDAGFIYCNSAKQLDRAEEFYLKGLALKEKLIAEEPSKQVWQASLAITCNNLGFVYYKSGRYQESEHFLLKALEIKKPLYADNPAAYSITLAKTHMQLGYLYRDTNKNVDSESHFHKSMHLLQRRLADEPEQSILTLARDYHGIGQLYRTEGKIDEAKNAFQSGIDILSQRGEQIALNEQELLDKCRSDLDDLLRQGG